MEFVRSHVEKEGPGERGKSLPLSFSDAVKTKGLSLSRSKNKLEDRKISIRSVQSRFRKYLVLILGKGVVEEGGGSCAVTEVLLLSSNNCASLWIPDVPLVSSGLFHSKMVNHYRYLSSSRHLELWAKINDRCKYIAAQTTGNIGLNV